MNMETYKQISDIIASSIVKHVCKVHDYELWEMSMCGKTNGLYLVIFSNDPGNIPHFHIFDNQNPKKSTIDVCLKLETPEYFKHGHHVDILNSKQMRTIIKLLKSKMNPRTTYWQFLVEIWNANNSKYEIPYDMEMPDYMSLIKTI